jgi:excinuclease ABC subunit C
VERVNAGSMKKVNIKNIPSSPGVYLMKDAAGKIIYIGKAGNLKKRIYSYFRNDNSSKISIMMTFLRHIDFVLASSESEALILENNLIKEYQPYFNTMWKDDKSYPYLKLTTKEDFPRLVLTRNKVNDGSEYFGPYPHVKEIKKLIYWFQECFHLRLCALEFTYNKLPDIKKVKSCIYLQSGKCPGPCVGKVDPKEYKKRFREIKLFLTGKYKKLLVLWEKEMLNASQNLDYEKARDARDRIKAIKLVNEKVTLREIKREDLSLTVNISHTLEELKNILDLKKWPVIIEAFDISNISGYEPVASMVRFHNGKPDKSSYRKFKIKTVSGINDPAMISEVVLRRYSRLKEYKMPMPDLVLIDGGKGQLNAAIESLETLKLKLPLISLAKKDEEVYTPSLEEPIRLPRSSKPLQLLQQIRDEAHRFAVTFHKQRRDKIFIK